jgi:hypothetical protein
MYDGAVFYQGAKLSLGPVIFVFAGSKLFEPPEGDNPLAETGTSEKKMSPTQFSVSFDRWRVAKEKRIRAIGTQPSQQARKSRPKPRFSLLPVFLQFVTASTGSHYRC